MGKFRTTVVAGLSLLLGLAAGGIATDQATAAGPNCKITVAVDRYVPVEVQPEITVNLSGCSFGSEMLYVDVTGPGSPARQSKSASNGKHLFWSGAVQPGDYRVTASVGSVRSSAKAFHIVGVPSAHSAGWKLVGEETNSWGSFDVDEPINAWTEVRVGNRWSKSQQRRTTANGGYTIPLTYGANTPGTYEFRVAGQYPGGTTIYSDSIWLERVARPTASSAGIKAVGEDTNAWGAFDVFTATRVWTEAWTGKAWSKSQERTTDRDGHYTIPLTYGANSVGTTRWRVAGMIDGTVVRTGEFTLQRVKAPTTASVASKPVGEETSTWGSFGTDGKPIKVWTEVLIGNRWSKSQERMTTADGGYTIPLTYGANQPGTTRWRVSGDYGGSVVRTGEFTLRRY